MPTDHQALKGAAFPGLFGMSVVVVECVWKRTAAAAGPGDADWIHMAKVRRMDWSDPEMVAMVIVEKMDGAQREAVIDWLIAAREPVPVEGQAEQ